MRIGIDVDGVVANFFSAYEKIVIDTAGVDLFGDRRYPRVTPAVWSWPEAFGYSPEVISKVWTKIKSSPDFWAGLTILPEACTWIGSLNRVKHDIYFITDRPGEGAKYWTEAWFAKYGFHNASVLISRTGKGSVVAALDLEVYIDDKVENILDVQKKAPKCRAYMAPHYRYNTQNPGSALVIRSSPTVKGVLGREGLI